MSAETLDWLNNYTLIGYADRRTKAWHYSEDHQGAEDNHYPGPVPVADVERRLFNFEVMESPIHFEVSDGEGGLLMLCDSTRKIMYRSDNHAVLGMFKEGYQGHGYKPWLIENVSTLIDDDLGIGSAGLLKNGAQAWVQIEMPESISTPEGVTFRPNLLACTSFDGTIATTYKRTITNVVCDNTMAMGLSEKGQTYKVKHSRHSNMKLLEARDALAIVHTMAEDYAAEVGELTSIKVSDGDWAKFLAEIAPIPEDEGKGKTQAENKQGEINRLYRHDERCAPWTGTAYGVIQTVNTFHHHSATIRARNTEGMDAGDLRAMRNAEGMVAGTYDDLDRSTYKTLMAVMG